MLHFPKTSPTKLCTIKKVIEIINKNTLIKEIFKLIGCPEVGTSHQSLEDLRDSFSRTIPYENISVLSNAEVPLGVSVVLEKLLNRRGGYCFELNLAFGELLKFRKLKPQMHLGRVWLREPTITPPRNHAANVIEIGTRKYIADVGFGRRAPRCLIPLFDFGHEIIDGDADSEPVRAIEMNGLGVMVQRLINSQWTNQYSLELEPAHQSDIDVANFFQANSPNSHFRYHLFAGRFTKTGRDGLFDNQLSRRSGSYVSVTTLSSLSEILDTLNTIFDIDAQKHEKALKKVLKNADRI